MRLQAVQIWWSPAPESPNPVTLVTQLSHDRLPQLEAQCASWGGRLSAVVYLSVPASPKADDVSVPCRVCQLFVACL